MKGSLYGFWLLGLWLIAQTGRAEDVLHSYALVVGSNRAGVGQLALSYAEQDAARIAALLHELGRTPREHVQLLSSPSAPVLRAALATLRQSLAEHAARGERTQAVFYYSGHARATALDLGEEEVSLAELRSALTDLPSSVSVVILDACQSGAFSGVKGAQAAADFSLVSVSTLRSEGLAVMASSTAAELSQESEELGAGYFTHHLLVGLRGAGDMDVDGRVSLDEAYRYAYAQTLASTARTRVGMQHATLETAISGRGDVPLTYTEDADAQLALPAESAGRILIQRGPRGAIIAELVKATGSELVLALPAGSYDLLLREERADHALACTFALTQGQRAVLETKRCARVPLDRQREKRRRPFERWFGELGISWSQHPGDAYVHSLETFGFAQESRWLGGPWGGARQLHANLALGLGLVPAVALLVRYDGLERQRYTRQSRVVGAASAHEDDFSWRAHNVSAGVRARYPLWDERFVPFAELTLGLGFARNVLDYETDRDVQRQFAPTLRAAAGLTLGGRGRLGFYLAGGFVYAPITRNELGDRHNDGGALLELGLRLRGVKGW